LVLLIAGVVWAFKGHADAQVEKLKRMQDQMFAGGPPKPDDFERMQKEMKDLTPDQRQQVWDHGRKNFQRQMEKQVDDYFAAPPEKRKEILDKQIQDMEKRRKEMEKRRKENGGQDGPPGGGPGQAGQGGPPGGTGAGPGGPGGQNRTPQQQSERRNQMLDSTSPAQRAKMAAYFSDLLKRRAQLGLPAFPGPPGGRPAGR